MTALREDELNKISVEASQQFVEGYYLALNSPKREISQYYVPNSTLSDGKTLPAIVFNGNVITDSAAMQKLIQEQVPRAEYAVGDFDCHVLNPDYVAEGAQAAPAASDKVMTILLTISGSVKYGESHEAEHQGFSETFVLLQNKPASGSTRSRVVKEWLIQSQVFRIVS